MLECCVCEESENILLHKCPNDHTICKTCYLSILQMCYCKNQLGEVLYKCPLCRNEHRYSNIKMNNILLDLVGSNEFCMRVCNSDRGSSCSITKKCQFEKCGCRINIVDIYLKNDLDLAIKDVVRVANKYKISKKVGRNRCASSLSQ